MTDTYWIDIENLRPRVGERVLIYGYYAPDGPSRIEVDSLAYVARGTTPYFNKLDVVTHWAHLDSIPTPEDFA